MFTYTKTTEQWEQIAGRLSDGSSIIFSTGSEQRMAPDLAEYILDQVSYVEDGEGLTLDFGDEAWDVAMLIGKAA